jgi:hypothetical protein
MRAQLCERRGSQQAIERGGDFARHHVQSAAHALQRKVQVFQALFEEFVVLRAGIRLLPKAGLDGVQAQHGAEACGMRQSGVVMQAQVAFEPNNAVAHE